MYCQNFAASRVQKSKNPYQITKKGKYQIRSISLPNNKKVPLHNELTQIPSQPCPQPHQSPIPPHPQFWGCLVSDHFKKIQKQTLTRSIRSKTQQKISKSPLRTHQKQRENSEILLEHYIRRKTQKEVSEENQVIQEIRREGGKRKRMVGVAVTEGLDGVDFGWDGEEFGGSHVQRYADAEARQSRARKSQEVESRIQRLNQLIRWRTKILQKIDSQLQAIKYSKINSY